MAQIASAVLVPHLKKNASHSPADFLLFPDEKNDLPEDVSSDEQAMMMRLLRATGG